AGESTPAGFGSRRTRGGKGDPPAPANPPTAPAVGTTSRCQAEQKDASSGNGRRVRLPLGLLLVQREQFLPVNRHVARGLDPQANLAAIDIHNGDTDVIADVDLFPELTTEYEHGATLR